jgi:2-keto-4-pentenoate hydratase/2-oxohepta-3-ene-1,7-dioic acid hydratase in catechol pathway
MKLGSLKEGGRDGTLIVVSRDLSRAVRASGIAPTLQAALDDWNNAAPRLNALSEALNDGKADGAFALDMAALAAPLPRAYEFVDGSAYLPHVERVRARAARKCRKASTSIRLCTKPSVPVSTARAIRSSPAARTGASTSKPKSSSSQTTCRWACRRRTRRRTSNSSASSTTCRCAA